MRKRRRRIFNLRFKIEYFRLQILDLRLRMESIHSDKIKKMKLTLFDYNLPKNLIAQKQVKPRDHSRLLVVGRKTKKLKHDYFYNLDKYLDENDVLVFNDSRVFPARIKFDGGKGEIFLLREMKNGNWEVMGKKLGKNFKFQILNFKINSKLQAQILKRMPDGNYLIKFNLRGRKFREWLEKYGETPLPPYIKTKDSKIIRNNYQTIYARADGSVAAPTAGFHFTKELMSKLRKKGVAMEFVTLHVGQGTFLPVKTDNIEEHKMHAEFAIIDKETAKRLNDYKKAGRRIIAVGTTSCRVLEAMTSEAGESSKLSEVSKVCLKAREKEVNIFIYPGYNFKFVDGLVTNFHLPKSTLLMLVAALIGREFILEVYRQAIKKKYRFYSFGDGMLIK